jgi:homoserine dehydrogenase
MTPARVALLGTGNVGSAVLARLAGWNGGEPGDRLRLAAIANTRSLRLLAPAGPVRDSDAGEYADGAVRALGTDGVRIVIDATASESIAGRHAQWLAAGVHVATACKLGQGGTLPRWHAIQQAGASSGTLYGDSATVGAGLPLLRSIRELRAGGDRIRAIAGILSGSLAWLLRQNDGGRSFAALVDEARASGYTEPDPRIDLSGEDVRRKLLILARAAGIGIEADAVDVEPLEAGDVESLRAQARRCGGSLAHVARLQRTDGGGVAARVGVEVLAAGDPLTGGAGTDNRVAIWSDRYPGQPLLIQGPGAGAGVTAAALLDDALRIARQARPYATAAPWRSSAARYADSGCGWSMA